MPTPKTSTSTPCSCVCGASRSSRTACSALMVRLERALVDEERRAGRLGRGRERARRLVAAGDDDARQAEREEAARRDAARFVARATSRYESSVSPRTCTRVGHDAVVVAREREPVLLHARVAQRAVEPGLAGDAPQVDAELRVRRPARRTVSSGIVSRRAAAAIVLRRSSLSPPRARRSRASRGSSPVSLFGRDEIVGGSSRLAAPTRRSRNALFRESRETRASVFRCSPVARFGPMTAKRMLTGCPSMAAKSTPSGTMSSAGVLRLELRQRAVRDRDPLADPRRLELLALDQHPLDLLAVDPRAGGEHLASTLRRPACRAVARLVVADGDALGVRSRVSRMGRLRRLIRSSRAECA